MLPRKSRLNRRKSHPMRIITGSAKGHTIKVPDKEIRPAQDMVRQAAFSMLHGLVEGANVLDLFAGSGSYGLEALSRGAEKAVFVDNEKLSVRTIRINLKEMGFKDRGKVVRDDVMAFVEDFGNSSKPGFKSESQSPAFSLPKSFNLIFLSPPYKMGAQVHLLKQLSKIVTPQGLIIFDHAKETEIPENVNGLQRIRSREYGATGITILAKKG